MDGVTPGWCHSMKKPGQTSRKRKKSHKRDTTGWDDIPLETPTVKSNEYEVVFVRCTRATTCYGCGRKVRQKPSSDSPPPPYDIFLCRHERRV